MEQLPAHRRRVLKNFDLAERVPFIDWTPFFQTWDLAGPYPTIFSVSGFYIGHPDSVYFSVGKIGEDQLQDLAQRRGMDVEALRRLLAPNLG